MSIAIKITGPCDTTGCNNPATIHYGLEEFYCLGCHEQNAAEQRRWEESERGREQKAKWEKAIFLASWPNYCQSCGAWGVFTYYDNHGVPGPGEQISDPCEKCEGFCPRCHYEFIDEDTLDRFYEDANPCPRCSWKWGENPGDTMPEFDLP